VNKGAHLRGLIQQRLDEGWSQRRIARQGDMSASTLSKLMRRSRETAPQDDVLLKLAEGLRMPPEVIFDAANKDWTTPPSLIKTEADDGSVLIIASQLKELSEQDRRTIQDLTDTLYRRMKEEDRRRANG
jgi:transcriptional regulator with XRE-family HTH domain